MSQPVPSVEAMPTNDVATTAEFLQAILRFLRVVFFRVEIVVVSLIASCLLGGLYYLTAEPMYQSTGSLVVLQMGADVQSTEVSSGRATNELIGMYQELVTSDDVMVAAVREIPKEHRVDFVGAASDSWPKVLKANLTVSTERQKNIIHVTYTSKSADAAKVVVDAVIKAYLDYMARLHHDNSKEIFAMLQRERQSLEQEIQQKQQAKLHALSVADELSINDGQANVVLRRAISLNEAYIKAHEERLEAEARLVAIREAIRNGTGLHQHVVAMADSVGREVLLRRLGLGGQSVYVQAQMSRQLLEAKAQLQTLQEQGYGPNHTRVRDTVHRIQMTEQFMANQEILIAAKVQSMTHQQLAPLLEDMASQRLDQAVAQEQTLWASYSREKATAVQLNHKMAELDMLEHDIERLRARNDVIREQSRNTKFHEDGSLLRTAIHRHPERPTRQHSPNLLKTAALSILAGLFTGMLIIYVLDLLDDRFRSPEEMQSQLGVAVLSMVQRLDPLEGIGSEAIHVCALPNAADVECFRTLRTTLAFLGGGASRLVVSSTEPGDGKTTVSSNLAAACAQAGRRTLIIDADLRRPGLTPQLGLRGVQGLSAVLRDHETPIAESALANTFPQITANLDVIPSGPRPSNPMELLAGERFSDLLGWAETVYDQIVIDCPPAMAVSDPAVVGRLVDGVVLVIRPDKNRRRPVMRTVERLRSLGVQVLGLVVNQVESSGSYGYYGYDYGYSYSYGHATADDTADETGAEDTVDVEWAASTDAPREAA